MILTEMYNLLLQVDDVADTAVEVAKSSKGALTAFGIKVVKWNDFFELIIRFTFNMLVTVVIAKGLYYTKTKRKDFLFCFIIMSVVIFLLCFSLSNIKLQLGFAFGLFAIFGIMRFRTDGLPIKEMTYLFVIIAVSVINAMFSKKLSYAELVFCNVAILAVLYFIEKAWLLKHESVKTIVFDRVDLIHVAKNKELIAELDRRTGLKVTRLEVLKIDYLKDIAVLQVYYFEAQQGIPSEISNFSPQNADLD